MDFHLQHMQEFRFAYSDMRSSVQDLGWNENGKCSEHKYVIDNHLFNNNIDEQTKTAYRTILMR